MANIKELKEKVNIVDYAVRIGFTPKKVGKYYTLKEHDSVRIDPERNIFFRNSTGEHGTVIDFALTFTNLPIGKIIAEMENMKFSKVYTESKTKDMDKDFILPEKDGTYKNVYAYLIKTRGIKKEIVDSFVKRKILFQDKHKNCVFISRKDGKPVFGSLRGTNTKHKYIADVSGSDYSYGLIFKNGSDTLIVTESAIDTLSFINLFPQHENSDYLSLSGVSKTKALINHIKAGNYKNLILALDNDEAGKTATEKIKAEIKELKLKNKINVSVLIPKEKDWNEDLCKIKGL